MLTFSAYSQFDCSATCTNYGPYFAGVDDAACRAQGGTFCRNPSDCSVLKTCIDTFVQQHAAQPLFVEYLKSAPKIMDSSKYDQCGRTRNFFGFDEDFIHDQAICDDVEQLRFSKDFLFLEQFFGGAPAGQNGTTPSCPTPPATAPVTAATLPPAPAMEPLVLAKINRDSSSKGPVKNGQAWRSTNFALDTALGLAMDIHEAWVDLKCPADPTGTSTTICASILNGGAFIFQAVVISLRVVSKTGK